MSGATFPRAARLLTKRDFARLREGARRLGSTHFAVQVAAGAGPAARLGLAVSRKVSRRAVRRNRIKRLARDSFRRHRQGLPAVDVLLIARPSADACDNAGLHAELELLWQRIAALKSPGSAGTMRG